MKAPARAKGSASLPVFMSTLPAFAYSAKEAQHPTIAPHWFVPTTIWGGMPIAIREGTIISPPPPHTESTIPPKNAAAKTISPAMLIIVKSNVEISMGSL